MTLSSKVSSERKKKGMTQEELAALTNVTVRTIQRIERGESIPRSFTVKAIASALGISFEVLSMGNEASEPITVTPHPPATIPPPSIETNSDKTEETAFESTRHFAQIFCLSCFSYIIIPYVHFLIPVYLLKKRKYLPVVVLHFAQKIIRTQIGWMVVFHGLLLLTLAYNILQAKIGNRHYLLNYLLVVFFMYVLNAVIICSNALKLRRMLAVNRAFLT